jgi:hypothetical protein
VNDSNPTGPAGLARLYTDIAFFRRGPADVPFSRRVLGLTVVAYLLLSLALSTVMPVVADNRVALILVDSALGLGWYWVVLKVAGRPERFLQTASAVFGFQTALQPLFVAVTWLFIQYMKDPTWQAPVSLLLLVLAIWMLAINARVLRLATEWPQFACIGVVMLQSLAGRLIEMSLFPDVTPPTP